MDLSLNEQQLMLKTMGADFLKQQLPKERVRQIDESPTGFDPDLWRAMSELGWAGIVIPEEYDGMGMTFVDLGVLYEVMGEAACSSPNLSSAVLSAQAILHAGDAAQKQGLLPAIASGEQIFSFAYTEPDYSWEADGVKLSAGKRDGSWTLNGAKLFVPDAHVADRLLVAARTSDKGAPEQGITLFLVEKDAPGVSVRLLSGWMATRSARSPWTTSRPPPSSARSTRAGRPSSTPATAAPPSSAPTWPAGPAPPPKWPSNTATPASPSACPSAPSSASRTT